MNRRRNPEQLPPHIAAGPYLRGFAFAVLWATILFADAITKALGG